MPSKNDTKGDKKIREILTNIWRGDNKKNYEEIIKHKQWDNTIKYKHGGDTLESSNLGNTMYKKKLQG